MPNFRLDISYDGSDFCGWQWQPTGRSIQRVLSEAIAAITGQTIMPTGSGRTDAGVHALGQVASLQLETHLDADALTRAFNSELPDDLVIQRVRPAAPDFCAQRSARWKHYRYVFRDAPLSDVFARRFCWQTRQTLDVRKMAAAADGLVGEHDFAGFQTQGAPRASTVRIVRRCEIQRQRDWIILDIEANGFLYNMVRTIAGSLYDVGRGKSPVEQIERILHTTNRLWAGITAPPQGLFLMQVEYDEPTASNGLGRNTVLGLD